MSRWSMILSLVMLTGTIAFADIEDSEGKMNDAKLPITKRNISEVLKCFKDLNLNIEDNANGFAKGVMGGPKEGDDRFHLFRAKIGHYLFHVTYDCGPACVEQWIKIYHIGEGCKKQPVKVATILPVLPQKAKRFISIPIKGTSIYQVSLPEGDLDIDPRFNFVVKAKYDWASDHFVKDNSFKEKTLPMSEENYKQYFP